MSRSHNVFFLFCSGWVKARKTRMTREFTKTKDIIFKIKKQKQKTGNVLLIGINCCLTVCCVCVWGGYCEIKSIKRKYHLYINNLMKYSQI